jgi:hypothetical protein
MKLNIASLAIGIGIGVAIVTAIVVVYVLQPRGIDLDKEDAIAAIAANNRSHFFMSGLVTKMSDDAMILDQTFGRPDFNDNPMVTVRLGQGGAFVSCKGIDDPTQQDCEDIISNRIGKEPVSVCALTRMFDGEFYAGKIWAESGCGPFPIETTSN